ncbi:MAG: sugar transferase [Aristaeellaceae bacterium]
MRVRLVRALNIVLMACTFVLMWALIRPAAALERATVLQQVMHVLICTGVYLFLGTVYEAFSLGTARVQDMMYSQMLALLMTDIISFMMLWLLADSVQSILRCWWILPVQVLLCTAWCWLGNKWYFRNFSRKRTLVITRSGEEDMQRMLSLAGFARKFDIVGSMPIEQLLSDPEAMLKDIDVVFLMNTDRAWAVMQRCAFAGVTVYRIPLVSEIMASRARPMTLFHMPMLRMDGYSPSVTYTAVKRLMDLTFSGLALLVLSPIMAVTALAIKLEDGGPVFYRQERLTQGNRPFQILKFRSMRVNAESDGVAKLSTGKNDPRVTKVGRVIRALRMDEMPQLVNILRGEMSIVGPRPERPELTEEYAKVYPEFTLRLLSKAGLTGYAQVYGKYNTTPEDKLRMDLMYILRPSILEDIKLMFATVKILFIPESTEGVAEGQTTAMQQSQSTDGERKAASGS